MLIFLTGSAFAQQFGDPPDCDPNDIWCTIVVGQPITPVHVSVIPPAGFFDPANINPSLGLPTAPEDPDTDDCVDQATHNQQLNSCVETGLGSAALALVFFQEASCAALFGPAAVTPVSEGIDLLACVVASGVSSYLISRAVQRCTIGIQPVCP